MTSSSAPGSDDTAEAGALTPEQRAVETINAIMTGADLGEQTLALSNEFTDRNLARLSRWLRPTR